MTDLHNGQDILDSRDIIARIEELEGERDELVEALEEAQENYDTWVSDREDSDGETDEERAEGEELATAIKLTQEALAKWDEDEKEDFDILKAFASDLENYGDWDYGESLIRYSYFNEYCQDMLIDCGDISKDLPRYVVIDWEATAENLKVDYTESDFDGVTYYMRA